MRLLIRTSINLCCTIIVCFLVSSAQANYGGGTGDSDEPYLIYDANQMNAIGAEPNDWDKHFKLMADIDLFQFTGTEFNIIGNGTRSFTGYFDGNDHTISNFSYNEAGTNYIGLFGRTGNAPADVGQIRNLTLVDVDVNGGTGRFVGALVGLARGSVINCRVNGGLVRGQEDVGGLIGSISYCIAANCGAACDVDGGEDVGGFTGGGGDQSVIIQCYATGQVTGDEHVGGLVGRNSGEIMRCYATGEVIGKSGNNSVGGLVGMTGPESTIQDSYARGNVTGELFVGGLLGVNWEATVTNCCSVGFVSGVTLVGGFIGNNNLPGANINCFWDNQSSGQDFGVGAGTSDGIYGRETAEMKMEVTFSGAGWDFNTPIWSINEGVDYPTLVFQEYVHDYGGGTGTKDDPFLIYTAEHMQEIGSKRYHWDMKFKLMNDIDLSQYDGQDGRPRFSKIGYYNGSLDYLAFTGVFDGNNCTISNFTYVTTTEKMVGMFGFAEGSNVVIKNLGLVNPKVQAAEGYQQIGALAGLFKDGTLGNCYVQGANVTGDFIVGALVGRLGEGTINNCQAYGNVVGNQSVGGLAGVNYEGTIVSSDANVYVQATSWEVGVLVGENEFGEIYGCSAFGNVVGDYFVGGLVGSNPFELGGQGRYGTINKCYATGHVQGTAYVGGLMGGNVGDVSQCYAIGLVEGDENVGGIIGSNSNILTESFAMGTTRGGHTVGGLVGLNYHIVSDCYSIGSAEGTQPVGGLIGDNWGGVITDCFWDEDVSELTNMCGYEHFEGTGCDDSCGKATTEMKTKTTFTSAGWDFVGETANGTIDIWRMCVDGLDYPRMAWEFNNYGDFVCLDGVNFLDFAVLGLAWLSDLNDANWNPACDIFVPNDNIIDELDLAAFTENWLAGM
jgi:hypothetical protein